MRFTRQVVTDLDVDLQAYTKLAQAAQQQKRFSPDLTGWPTYAAVVGSGMALATAAGADIMYSGVQNISASVPPALANAFAVAPINLDGVGGVEFRLAVEHDFGNTTQAARLDQIGVGNPAAVLLNGSAHLRKLASGAIISNGAPGGFGSGHRALRIFDTSFNGFSGTWPAGMTGFAGFRFNISGNQHYGWIRLRWEDLGGISGGPDGLTAIDWAYNTVPNELITAGAMPSVDPDPTSVPEPSTLLLGALAAGATSVLTWRRRVAAKTQPTQ